MSDEKNSAVPLRVEVVLDEVFLSGESESGFTQLSGGKARQRVVSMLHPAPAPPPCATP